MKPQTAISFAFLLCVAAAAAASNQISVVEKQEEPSNTGEEAANAQPALIGDDASETPGVWKTLGPDEPVPMGSHVRVDVSTGARSIKIGHDPEMYSDEVQEMEKILHGLPKPDPTLASIDKNKLSPEEYEQAIRKIWEHRQAVIKDAMENVQVDAVEMQKHLQQLIADNSTVDSKLLDLDYLEYFVGDVDNANDFFNMGGLEVCTLLLDHNVSSVRAASAYVIGSAVKHQPELQAKVQKYGTFGKTLVQLNNMMPCGTEHQAEAAKMLYALGSMIRGSESVHLEAKETIVADLFQQILASDQADMKIRAKVATLVLDILGEEFCKSTGSEDGLIHLKLESEEEALAQLEKLKPVCEPSVLVRDFTTDGWCQLVSDMFGALAPSMDFDASMYNTRVVRLTSELAQSHCKAADWNGQIQAAVPMVQSRFRASPSHDSVNDSIMDSIGRVSSPSSTGQQHDEL